MYNPLHAYIEQKILKQIHQDKRDSFFSFQTGLIGLSALYKAIVLARTSCYANGLLSRKTLPCPVISIGNIMAGGTGKTPVAISIARMLKDMGKICVVISRGYKGKASAAPVLVGDGNHLLVPPEEAGDEPSMMARDFSLAVVVGKKRYDAGRLALSALSPDVIILDDGFQHLALKRDLDIILLDHDRPFGNKRLLPAGLLREPVSNALKRCHAIVRTRCPQTPKPFFLPDNIPNLPVFNTRHLPALIHLQDQNKKPLPLAMKALDGKNAVLFSGIARNNKFKETMEELGCRITSHLEFPDHHSYTSTDMININRQIQQDKADLVITTQKDMIKIHPDTQWAASVAVMGVTIQWEDETKIRSMLSQALSRFQ